MSILTYISHRLRNSRIKKLLTTIVQPSNLSWFKPRPPKVYRKRKLPSRFFRPKHIYITPPQPSRNLTWQRLRRLKLHSRPLWRFFRPKHIIFPPAQPLRLMFRALRRLRLHSRPNWRFFRPRHIYITPPQPSNLVWKALRRLRLRSRPLFRFFRPKHIIFPPAQPSNLSWQRQRRLRLHSRPSWRFFRPKHTYAFVPVIVAPATIVFRALRRLRLRSRPLVRFFRPRHVIFPPAQPASVISYKRPPRPKIKRARSSAAMLARHRRMWVDSSTAPPVVVSTYFGQRGKIMRLLGQGPQ